MILARLTRGQLEIDNRSRFPPFNQQVDPRLSTDLKAYDFRKVIDNGTVARLVKEGFFQSLFGAGIKAEESRKAGQAFK